MNAIYESVRFEDEFLRKMRESDMWKRMSGSYELPWSETLIDKHADQWDWEELSENNNIPWTVSMLDKYKTKIHWKRLSRSFFSNRCTYRRDSFFIKSNDEISTLLRKYSDFWHWETISRNAEFNFSVEIIEAFANRWVWKELIDNRSIGWNYELFERFRVYIPLLDIDNLKRSSLWAALLETDMKIMTGKILSE